MVATIKSENRSGLREFVAFLATVRGDLSTISAPPFILAPQSLVEFPSYWAERPALFAAPALEPDPSRRALLVLKVWLSALKRQFYIGVPAGVDVKTAGIKKPLNPFLGECFLGEWDDGHGARTRVVSEQVSHHPPTTACYLSSPTHGISASAHSTQATTLTLSGGLPTVIVRQSGHAVLNIPEYGETHLLPLPDIRVKGFLTGAPYPELLGTYAIVSSSGFTTEISFSGKGWVRGAKNSFDAIIFRTEDKDRKPVWTSRGTWSERFAFFKGDDTTTEIDSLDVLTSPTAPLSIAPLEQQDAWESRRAWGPTIAALQRGDFYAVVAEKAKIENAQRRLRKAEKERGETWEAEYFKRVDVDDKVTRLSRSVKGLDRERLVGSTGVWRFDAAKEEGRRRSGLRGRGDRDGTSPSLSAGVSEPSSSASSLESSPRTSDERL